MAALLFLSGLAAILVKHNTLFIVWMLFVRVVGWWRAAWWMAAVVALFLLSFVPFAPGGLDGIVSNVFAYGGVTGYGLSMVLPDGIARLIFYGAMLLLPLIAPDNLPEALALAALGTITLMYGIAQQYFALVLVLCVWRAELDAEYTVVTLLTAVLVALHEVIPEYMQAMIMFGGLWSVSMIWFVRWTFRRRREIGRQLKATLQR